MELVAENLKKEIGKKLIFRSVSFSLKKGEALAIRGVNGSGKTTLIRILAGLDPAFEGKVFYPEEKSFSIGYLSQEIVLFDSLTVLDNLSIFCTIYSKRSEVKKAIESYAARFDFHDLLSKKVCHLSGGQRRLIHITACLINEPELLLLDEAIVGVDEDKKRLIESFLLEIRKDRRILFTSHQEDFLKNVANRFARLEEGELVAEDEKNENK